MIHDPSSQPSTGITPRPDRQALAQVVRVTAVSDLAWVKIPPRGEGQPQRATTDEAGLVTKGMGRIGDRLPVIPWREARRARCSDSVGWSRRMVR